MDNTFYLVISPHGGSMHYVCCLIKIAQNDSFFATSPMTNDYGMYDKIFGAHLIHETIMELVNNKLVPPSAAGRPNEYAEIFIDNFKQVLDGTLKLDRDYYVEKQIGSTHISNEKFLRLFLKKIPNSKIIFITCDDSDIPIMVKNLFVKRYINGLLENDFFSGFHFLTSLYKQDSNLFLFDQQRVTTPTHEDLNQVYKAIFEIDFKNVIDNYRRPPIEDSRIISIKFSDLSNSDRLINKIVEITGVNNSTENLRIFTSYFENNQPTDQSIQNLLNKVPQSKWSKMLYTYAIPYFANLTSSMNLWKECCDIYRQQK